MTGRVSGSHGNISAEGLEQIDGQKLIEQRDEIKHIEEVEKEAEPTATKRRVEKFLRDDEALDSLFKAESRGRRLLAAIVNQPQNFLCMGLFGIVIGAPFLTKGAVMTGVSLGAAAPVGLPMMAFGLAAILAGLGFSALSVDRMVRMDKAKKKIYNSPELSPEIKRKLHKSYETETRKEANIKFLAAKIKYDQLLSQEEQADLLEPYSGKKIQPNDVKELSSAYNELRELNLLKRIFNETGQKISDIKENSVEDFYRKAREKGLSLNIKSELEGVRRWRGRRKQIKQLIDGYGGDAHFWKRLAAIDGKVQA